MGQIERAEVVDAKCDLKVLFCSVIWWNEDTSVVNQDMQWQLALLEFSSEFADRAANSYQECQWHFIAIRQLDFRSARTVLSSPERRQVDLHTLYYSVCRGFFSELVNRSVAAMLCLGCNDNMGVLMHKRPCGL